MKIIATGATGLVGSKLVSALLSEEQQLTRLVRRKPQGQKPPGVTDALWEPATGLIEAAQLEGHDAVVHLAGDNVAGGRWTAEKKQRIRDSRVEGTKLLVQTLTQLASRPRTLVSASAIGFYGNRGDELVNEDSPAGADFLAGVCREWEAATEPAAQAGMRVVLLRIGVVLSGDGGALQKMLTPFKLGVGGRVGSGRQYMSWVSLDDVVGVIKYALTNESLRGPINVVAPQAATNEEFTKTLGRVLGRPTLFPAPAFALRLAFGEMADALLLGSTRVEPRRLGAAGYQFQHPRLEGALRSALNNGD
ncbi:MAG: TIGR01777 family oxidoreductase [Pyrinomonadaceae bacterium]